MPEPTHETMETRLFGPVTLDGARVVEFERGLLGFPRFRRWVFLDGEAEGMSWLQSLDHPALAFLLVNPFAAFPYFTLRIGSTELRALGARHASELTVCALVTIAPDLDVAGTANLQGPLLINLRERRGMQVVIADSEWTVREALPSFIEVPRFAAATALVK
ncbi:MAG TPA: flagellar assembly protein FliW [Gemmatimonadaceae bacterium]|nr:flagellar assembly protein FliW [Gemmatimonadaceae bacterium]